MHRGDVLQRRGFWGALMQRARIQEDNEFSSQRAQLFEAALGDICGGRGRRGREVEDKNLRGPVMLSAIALAPIVSAGHSLEFDSQLLSAEGSRFRASSQLL